MHLALNYKGKALSGYCSYPSKNELWIAVGKKSFGVEKKTITLLKNLFKSNKSLSEMVLVTK